MKRYRKIINFVVFALCLIYMIGYFVRHGDEIKVAFDMSWYMVSGVLLLSVLHQVLHSFRFKVVLEKCGGRRLPFFPWFRIYILGRFLNLIFPQSGNIYRSVCLKKEYDIAYTHYISGFASFAWMDMILNFLLAAGCILAFQSDWQIHGWRIWLFFLVLSIVATFLPFLLLTLLNSFEFQRRGIDWLRGKLTEVLSISLTNLRDGVYISKVVFLGLVVFFRTVLIYYLIFRSLEINPGLTVLIMFYVLFKCSTFIVITPGNIGVQELAYGVLGEQLGIGMAEGILASLVTRVVSTVVIMVLGLMCGGADIIQKRNEFDKQVPSC